MTTTYHSIIALEHAHIRHVPESLDALDFQRGVPIINAPPVPWVFDIEMDWARPLHFFGGRIPIASDTLLTVLRDAGIDNMQMFPTVLRSDDSTWQGHFTFNVIGLVDATDSDGAAPAEPDGQPAMVVSRNGARGFSLFRLFHDPAVLVVDGRVMRALNAHRPPEGWGFSAFEIEVSD